MLVAQIHLKIRRKIGQFSQAVRCQWLQRLDGLLTGLVIMILSCDFFFVRDQRLLIDLKPRDLDNEVFPCNWRCDSSASVLNQSADLQYVSSVHLYGRHIVFQVCTNNQIVRFC